MAVVDVDENREVLRHLSSATFRVYKRYFVPIRDDEKIIHIDNSGKGIEDRDIVRFINGYDPENGEVFRTVYHWERKMKGRLTLRDISLACIKDLEWFDYYADDYVYLFYIEPVYDSVFEEKLEEEGIDG